jgi:hypothetical protein
MTLRAALLRLGAVGVLLTALLGGQPALSSAAPAQTQSGSGAVRGLPYLSRDATALAQAKHSPRASSVPVAGAASGRPTAPSSSAPGTGHGNVASVPAATLLTGFPGTTHDADVALQPGSGGYPSPQDVRPPDDNIAVSSASVAEVVNSYMFLSSRGGSARGSVSLYNLVPPPSSGVCWRLGNTPYEISDPRIEYDPGSQRWYLTAAEIPTDQPYTGGSCVVILVSQPTTSSCPNDINPSSSCWYDFGISYAQAAIDDQPKVGFSDDKVVLSWNTFNFALEYVGEQTWVLQKSDLLGGTALRATQLFNQDLSRFGVVPAQSVSSTSDEWAVYNNSDALNGEQNTSYPSLGMIRITGTPAAGDVSYQEYDPAMTATNVPPPALQEGTSVEIDTGDDRLLGAVWEYGELWTTADDACSVQSQIHACARFIEANASGSTAGMVPGEDWDLGMAGTDVYYAAATVDANGDMISSVTTSSTSTHPSVDVLGQLNGAQNGPNFFQLVQAGTTAYTDTTGCSPPSCSNIARWGDYGGAAFDPSDTHGAWVSGEYAVANTLSETSNENWGTYIEDVEASGPGPQGFSIPSAGNPVTVLTPSGGQELIFWRGPSDGHLYEAWYGFASGQWAGPVDMTSQLAVPSSGDLLSAPTVTFTPDGGQQLVFWQGANDDLWEAWYSYRFGNWQVQDLTSSRNLAGAGKVDSAPMVTFTPGGGQQLVFWRGANNDLWEAWYSLTFSVWQSQDLSAGLLAGAGAGTVVSTPDVILTPGGGQQLAFWQGSNGHVWEAWYSVQFRTWQVQDLTAARFPTAANIASQPDVILTPGGGQQLVFYQAAGSGDLWEAWYTLSSSGWAAQDLTTARLGGLGAVASEPMVIVSPDGNTQLVFWQSAADHLDEAWYSLTSATWAHADLTAQVPLPAGAALSGPPSPLLLANGEQDVWWQGTSQSLWELRYGVAATDWSS